eukprot:GHVO01051410.1.p1 GENE.GHVO01051410.1~~GHVO01051410.1.p1  ORF type:complete len:216 (-),score=36.18 GHVO01051410.1:228-875(-)
MIQKGPWLFRAIGCLNVFLGLLIIMYAYGVVRFEWTRKYTILTGLCLGLLLDSKTRRVIRYCSAFVTMLRLTVGTRRTSTILLKSLRHEHLVFDTLDEIIWNDTEEVDARMMERIFGNQESESLNATGSKEYHDAREPDVIPPSTSAASATVQDGTATAAEEEDAIPSVPYEESVISPSPMPTPECQCCCIGYQRGEGLGGRFFGPTGTCSVCGG